MVGLPDRTPRVIQLPGLGFFHQAPTGHENLVIGPRRAQFATFAQSIPASSTVNVGPPAISVLPQAQRFDAAWVEFASLRVWCSDASGQLSVLQANDRLSGNLTGGGFGSPDLAFFALTNLQITLGRQTVMLSGQQLWTVQDLIGLTAFGPSGPNTNIDTAVVNLITATIKNSDAGAAHTVNLDQFIVWRMLSGLYE